MWDVPVFHSAGHIKFCYSTSACLTSRKTLKQWRKRFFFYLLECSNSEPLHSAQVCTKAEARPLTSIDFCWSIIDDLVHEHLESSNRPTVGHPRLRPTPIRLSKKLHLFNQCTANCNCVVCSGETRHITSYYCTNCPEEPALIPRPFTPPAFDHLQWREKAWGNFITWSTAWLTSRILNTTAYSHSYPQLQRS